MDLTCFNWVQLIKKTHLPSNAKLIALYLSTFMNAEHDIAWPAQSRISYETGLSEPSVRKWVFFLEDNGWLVVKSKSRTVDNGKQRYLHNEYLINIPEQRVNELLSGNNQRVNSLPPDSEQRVKKSRAEGKLLTTNNNRITNNIYNKFKPPTINEVITYCQERKNDVDPLKWWNFYDAKDWMIGKNKMKNWKSAIHTWEKEKDTFDPRDHAL